MPVAVPDGALMTFSSHNLEREWRAAFDASLLPADASWTLFMIAFRLATLARFHDVGAHSLWLAADAAAGGALLWLQRRRPATYLARRGALVAAVRWARAVHGYYYYYSSAAREDAAFLLRTGPAAPWSAADAFFLMRKPIMMMMQTGGFRVPLLDHALLSLPYLLMLLSTNARRCAAECAAGPARAAGQYGAAAAWLDELRRRAFPFAPARAGGARPCATTCVSIHSFAQVFFGFVIPTAALAAFEEHARLDFLAFHGGTPFHASARALLSYSAALLPLAAALVWAALPLALEAAGAARAAAAALGRWR